MLKLINNNIKNITINKTNVISIISIIALISVYMAFRLVKMQNANKQLMNLKRIVLLLLLANAIAITLIYIPDFSNKIDEIATFLTSGIIAGIVYSYFTEKIK